MKRKSGSDIDRNLIKIFLSCWIVYHLVVMVVVPNQLSYLYVNYTNLFGRYANLVGIHSAWQFFSPDPAPPVYYEFKLHGEFEKPQTDHYPLFESPYFFRQDYNRRVAVKNIALKLPAALDQLIVPHVCKRNPGARSAEITQIIVRTPSLNEVSEGTVLNNLEDREYQALPSAVCPQEEENAG